MKSGFCIGLRRLPLLEIANRQFELLVVLSSLLRPLATLARILRPRSFDTAIALQHLHLRGRRSQLITLVSIRILLIRIANNLNARRKPLLERLRDKVSILREPCRERCFDLPFVRRLVWLSRGNGQVVRRIVLLRLRVYRDLKLVSTGPPRSSSTSSAYLLSVSLSLEHQTFLYRPHPICEEAVQYGVGSYSNSSPCLGRFPS